MSSNNFNSTTKKALVTSEIAQVTAVQTDGQGSNPLGANTGLYTNASNELVYRDGTNSVQITNGGSVNAPTITSLTSSTNLNMFIDNDNTSTTDRFNVYRNVLSPDANNVLLAVRENRQTGFNTDTPFTNIFATASLLSTSGYEGVHIRAQNTFGTLILEGNSRSELYMIGRSDSAWKQSVEGNSWQLQELNSTLGTTRADFTIYSGGDGGNTSFKLGTGGTPVLAALMLMVKASAANDTTTEFIRTTAGTRQNFILRNFTGTNHTTKRAQLEIVDINGSGVDNCITMRPGLTAGSCRVGINTVNPNYTLEVDRSAAGTNVVRAAGDTATTGFTLQAYRNLTSTSTDSPVASVFQDHASDDQDALQVRQDGTGNILNLTNGGVTQVAVAASGVTTFSQAINLRTLSSAASLSSARESVILITDTSVARTVTLSTSDTVDGRVIIVKDASGAAGTNSITIDTQGAELIDGATSTAISSNFGVIRLVSNGTNWFTI
jgi:hypothetical protein